jgi:hypothetical protein
MMLKALIVEQLEADGTLLSLRMRPSSDSDLVVSFAHEYAEPRHGPFHFLDERDEERFRDGFAHCRARSLGRPNFHKRGNSYHVKTSWKGIPTERSWLSYYALSLPLFAIPTSVSISDPHRPDREYRRYVTRDDVRNRFVIYLECASSMGRFDFDLACDFVVDEKQFSTSEYQQTKSAEHGWQGEDWKYCLNEAERERIQQFFIGSIQMGDIYSAGQAGAMGPNAQATNNTFQQLWQQNQGAIDLRALAHELQELRTAMRREASTPAHDMAVADIDAAQTEAVAGNGAKTLEHLRSAGKWAFDVSTKIGIGVAIVAIKIALGS